MKKEFFYFADCPVEVPGSLQDAQRKSRWNAADVVYSALGFFLIHPRPVPNFKKGDTTNPQFAEDFSRRETTGQSLKQKNSFFIQVAVKCIYTVPFLTRVVSLECLGHEHSEDTTLVKKVQFKYTSRPL